MPAVDQQLEDGQTPLDPDEAAGLIPLWIATRADLNAAEAENISASYRWADTALRRGLDVASDAFLRQLHVAMFGNVWRWAGTYRDTERNIGVAPHQINMQLRQLFDDVGAWPRYDAYSLDERAFRLHHRLTVIHPFPNGNGRAARLMADHYLVQRGSARFTWGTSIPADQSRPAYLAAIRSADAGDFRAMAAFVRS